MDRVKIGRLEDWPTFGSCNRTMSYLVGNQVKYEMMHLPKNTNQNGQLNLGMLKDKCARNRF